MLRSLVKAMSVPSPFTWGWRFGKMPPPVVVVICEKLDDERTNRTISWLASALDPARLRSEVNAITDPSPLIDGARLAKLPLPSPPVVSVIWAIEHVAAAPAGTCPGASATAEPRRAAAMTRRRSRMRDHAPLAPATA
jgi:hypothetical protein